MKFLSKIIDLNWLGDKKTSNNLESKFSVPHDISVAHFEDEGGIYLIAFDGWSREEIQEFVAKGDFIHEWQRKMNKTGICIMSGRIGKGEEIEIVYTSLSEVFKHEEESG